MVRLALVIDWFCVCLVLACRKCVTVEECELVWTLCVVGRAHLPLLLSMLREGKKSSVVVVEVDVDSGTLLETNYVRGACARPRPASEESWQDRGTGPQQ